VTFASYSCKRSSSPEDLMKKYIALVSPSGTFEGMASLDSYNSWTPDMKEYFVEDCQVLVFEGPDSDGTEDTFDYIKKLAEDCVNELAIENTEIKETA